MRHTVVWVPSAENDLARKWNDNRTRRQAIADAADEIDRRLRVAPEKQGIDWGGQRYLEVEPLAVVFEIIPDDMMVRVLDVWLLD